METEICALKQHLYKGNRCGRCLGIPTVRCYATEEEFNFNKDFFYEIFSREFPLDGGRLEELLVVARAEEDACSADAIKN
ncbi:MAG: hypothetical protein AABX54_03480 [Nanoarchaeota archaeon]